MVRRRVSEGETANPVLDPGVPGSDPAEAPTEPDVPLVPEGDPLPTVSEPPPPVEAKRPTREIPSPTPPRKVVGRVVERVFRTLSAYGITVPAPAHRQAISDLEAAIASGELQG